MYATTRQFLDYFNLKTLDQLPALADIRDLETLNAELGFSAPAAATPDTAPGLTVVGGTDHVSAPPAPDGNEANESDEPVESGETTAMDLAVTAAELVTDDAPASSDEEAGERVADADEDSSDPKADSSDPAVAGPDSRS